MRRLEDMFFQQYKEYKELVAIEILESRNKILNLRKAANGDFVFEYKRRCEDFIEPCKLYELFFLYMLSHRWTATKDALKIEELYEKYKDVIEDDIREELEYVLNSEPEPIQEDL